MTTSKPGPKTNPDSKRNSDDWVAFTAFLTPATRDRLQKFIHRLKACGLASPSDQSELLERAVKALLDQLDPLLLEIERLQMEGK